MTHLNIDLYPGQRSTQQVNNLETFTTHNFQVIVFIIFYSNKTCSYKQYQFRRQGQEKVFCWKLGITPCRLCRANIWLGVWESILRVGSHKQTLSLQIIICEDKMISTHWLIKVKFDWHILQLKAPLHDSIWSTRAHQVPSPSPNLSWTNWPMNMNRVESIQGAFLPKLTLWCSKLKERLGNQVAFQRIRWNLWKKKRKKNLKRNHDLFPLIKHDCLDQFLHMWCIK